MAYTEPEPQTPEQERKVEAGVLLIICLMLLPFMAYFTYYEARQIRNWYVVSTKGVHATAQVEELTSYRRSRYVKLRWQDSSGSTATYGGASVTKSLWSRLQRLVPDDRKLSIIYLLENGVSRLPPVVVEDLSSTRFTSIAFALVFSIATLLSGWGIWYNRPIVLGRKV